MNKTEFLQFMLSNYEEVNYYKLTKTQYNMLRTIGDREVTTRQISDELDIDFASIQQRLNRLYKKCYLVRNENVVRGRIVYSYYLRKDLKI